MIHKEEIIDIVQEALFANFAFPPSVMDTYLEKLDYIDNIDGLVETINNLGVEYRKDKYNAKPPINLIIDTYNKRVMSNLRNNTICNLCNNKGSIISFADYRGKLIEWKKGIKSYPGMLETMLICECEHGNDIIKFPQKNSDHTVSKRSTLIEKYGLTYRDAKRTKLIKIALEENNKISENKADSLDAEMVLYWFTKFFLYECRNKED